MSDNNPLVNPIPYKIANFTYRGYAMSIKIENPNGLNKQKITIKRKKNSDEIPKSVMDKVRSYLEYEGYLFAAKQHNIYFEDDFD